MDAASDTSAPEIIPNTFLSYPKRVRTEDAATSTIGKSRSSICSWYYDQYRNGPEIEGALNQANKICSKHVNNGSNEWAFMDVSLSDLDSSQPSSVQRRKCSTRKRPQCSTSTQNISNLANSTQSFGQDRLDFDGESLSKCYFTGSKNGDIQSGENLVRGVDGMCFVPQTDPWTSKPVARHLHTQTSDGFPVIPTAFEPIQDKVTQPAWWLSKYSWMEYQQNGFYDSAKFSYTTVNQPVPFDPASSPFHSLTTSSSTECSRSLGEMIPNSSINEQTTTGSVHPFDLDVASMVSPDALKTGQSHPDPRLQNRAEHQTFQAPSSAESPWYPLTETSTHSQSITPPTMHAGPIQLWQFLLEELQNPNSRDYISWTGHGTEFKLKEPHQVAKLWGARKNKPKMNYEKLSRGLRYYYDKRIIQKVSGKRYVYRFTQNVYELLRSQAETYGFGWEPCVAKGAMTSPQDILRTEYGQCEPRLI